MGFVADAIGGIAGKVGNMFGIGGGMNQFQGNNADYVPNINAAMGNALGADKGMQDFITALQGQMNGQGPSVAQELLKRSLDANNANAASSVASVRGMNPALAQKLILDQQAGQNQAAAGQGATLRAQEMLGTRGLLANALMGRMGGNTALLGTMAGANQGQNAIGAGVAGQNADITSKAIGGLLGGMGGVGGMMGMGGGGGAGGGLTAASAGQGILQAGGPVMAAGMGIAGGGEVPGRAQTSGDAPANDTVPAKLSPGEIVIPRSIAQAEDAPERAAAFVRAIRRQKEPEGYGKALSRVRELDARLKHVEAMCAGGRVAA